MDLGLRAAEHAGNVVEDVDVDVLHEHRVELAQRRCIDSEPLATLLDALELFMRVALLEAAALPSPADLLLLTKISKCFALLNSYYGLTFFL